MPLSSYSALQTSIVSWANRLGDLTFAQAVPDFIGLAEARLNRSLRLLEQEASATIPLTDGVGDLPDDYLQYRSATFGGNVLDYYDPQWAAGMDLSGSPSGFAIIGKEIKVYPSGSGNLTLSYFQAIPPLAENATNWVLEGYPSLYLYGALLEAAPFLQDDDRLATWGELFARALNEAKASGDMAKFANVSVRVSGPTP
jgi:hypothetical protein